MNNHIELRDVTEDDLPIFYEQQTDMEAVEMAAFSSREREPFMAHWKNRVMADDTIIKKTILYNGQVAGNMVCFELFGERDVGYWLGKEYWGKGIATNALSQFLPLIDERPLYARVAKHNVGSRRVLEKNGFQLTGEDKNSIMIGGQETEEFILKLES